MKKDSLSLINTDFTSENIILGIDEAGRGPVIGALVYACAYWAENNEKEITKYLKFDDSKKLTPEKRSQLFDDINKYSNIIHYEKVEIFPDDLSRQMLSREKVSLNLISQTAAAQLIIMALQKGANITKVYVDTIGPEEKYKNFLEKQIKEHHKNPIEIIVEKKADAKYKTVSAASIVAKVTRDNIIQNWNYKEKEIGEFFTNNTGSGYPSDPYTKNWLEKNFDETFGYPNCIRFSWKTIDEIFKKKNCNCTWENYDEEEEKRKEAQKYKKKNNQPNKIDPQQSSLQFVIKDKGYYENYDMSFDVDI